MIHSECVKGDLGMLGNWCLVPSVTQMPLLSAEIISSSARRRDSQGCP